MKSVIETTNWRAHVDARPPIPDSINVIGEVYVPNPGVIPQLSLRCPQGINADILLLDLHLVQGTGNWTQQFVWTNVRFEKVIMEENVQYESVEIFLDSESVAKFDVTILS